ncbi:MAG TPA: DUF2254 domain-containing protein [Kribbella sp.]
MPLRLRITRFLDQNHWVLSMICVLGAIALALTTLAIDRRFDYSLVPETITGTATAAQTLLSTIVTAMVTLMTLVLTIMTLAVQLAMEQFSPRIVPALLRDRGNKLSMGLFGGAAAYAFIAASSIDDQNGRVPGLTVVISYLLMLASLVVLILYISRSGDALRAAGLIDLVGDHLQSEIERLPQLPDGTQYRPSELILATEPGVIVLIDEPRLVRLAQDADVMIELCVMMGDFVPAGGPLARIHGDAGRLEASRVNDAVLLGPERTHHDDPVFALTKLVEIATRRIAEDPITTVQAIDRIHDALRNLAGRELPTGRYTDGDGELRLVIRMLDWDGYVRLAFDEIREAGAHIPKVARRLRSALLDLSSVAPGGRRKALEQQLRLLDHAAGQAPDDRAAEQARTPDVQGIGSGRDLTGS